MPSYRFFLQIGSLHLALCAGCSAAILGSATWGEAQVIHHLFIMGRSRNLQDQLTKSLFEGTRIGLATVALILFFGLASLTTVQNYKMEWRATCAALLQCGRNLLLSIRQMTSWQRRWVVTGLLILTALRLYFSLVNTPHDDAASYLYFVRAGLLATSAYYPEPNNHVFSNTISWAFYQVAHGFWWSMRLPVLLTSTLATLILILTFVRRIGFNATMVAIALFSLLQGSLYQAGAGRGYWLVILFAGIIFFSTIDLAAEKRHDRAAWIGILVSGSLGCYTIPIFAYVLISAFSWLGYSFLRQRRYSQLLPLGAIGAFLLLSVGLLYMPLLLISGIQSVIGNSYVIPRASGDFWTALPTYIWHSECALAGHRALGGLLTIIVLGLAVWLFHQGRTGQLPYDQAVRLQQLVPPILWFTALPYIVMMLQRVFAPERVLLYKALFSFVLVGLVVDWLRWRWPYSQYRWFQRLLISGFSLFIAYQVFIVARGNPTTRSLNDSYHAGMQWLATQPVGPVLLPEPMQCLYFQFYAATDIPSGRWQLDNTQNPAVRYRYIVSFPNDRGFFQPIFPFPPVYQNSDVIIYTLPKSYPLSVKPWSGQ